VVFVVRLLAGQLDIKHRSRAFDLELHRDSHFLVDATAVDHERHQQVGAFAGCLAANFRGANRDVAAGRPFIGQQMNPHALRQLQECVAQRLPTSAFGCPVVFALIGGNPDFGAAGALIANVFVCRFEHPRNVGRGAGGAGGWQAH
jgi:hypothetical protein